MTLTDGSCTYCSVLYATFADANRYCDSKLLYLNFMLLVVRFYIQQGWLYWPQRFWTDLGDLRDVSAFKVTKYFFLVNSFKMSTFKMMLLAVAFTTGFPCTADDHFTDRLPQSTVARSCSISESYQMKPQPALTRARS